MPGRPKTRPPGMDAPPPPACRAGWRRRRRAARQPKPASTSSTKSNSPARDAAAEEQDVGGEAALDQSGEASARSGAMPRWTGARPSGGAGGEQEVGVAVAELAGPGLGVGRHHLVAGGDDAPPAAPGGRHRGGGRGRRAGPGRRRRGRRRRGSSRSPRARTSPRRRMCAPALGGDAHHHLALAAVGVLDGTTRSAPTGTGAPVMMRTARAGGRTKPGPVAGGDEAGHRPPLAGCDLAAEGVAVHRRDVGEGDVHHGVQRLGKRPPGRRSPRHPPRG